MREETLYDLGHFLPFGYAFDSDHGMRRVTYREDSSGEHGSGEWNSVYYLESSGDDPIWRRTERC
jgi:hypothetical protein